LGMRPQHRRLKQVDYDDQLYMPKKAGDDEGAEKVPIGELGKNKAPYSQAKDNKYAIYLRSQVTNGNDEKSNPVKYGVRRLTSEEFQTDERTLTKEGNGFYESVFAALFGKWPSLTGEKRDDKVKNLRTTLVALVTKDEHIGEYRKEAKAVAESALKEVGSEGIKVMLAAVYPKSILKASFEQEVALVKYVSYKIIVKGDETSPETREFKKGIEGVKTTSETDTIKLGKENKVDRVPIYKAWETKFDALVKPFLEDGDVKS